MTLDSIITIIKKIADIDTKIDDEIAKYTKQPKLNLNLNKISKNF